MITKPFSRSLYLDLPFERSISKLRFHPCLSLSAQEKKEKEKLYHSLSDDDGDAIVEKPD